MKIIYAQFDGDNEKELEAAVQLAERYGCRILSKKREQLSDLSPAQLNEFCRLFQILMDAKVDNELVSANYRLKYAYNTVRKQVT